MTNHEVKTASEIQIRSEVQNRVLRDRVNDMARQIDRAAIGSLHATTHDYAEQEWVEKHRDLAAEAMVDTADLLVLEDALKNVLKNERLKRVFTQIGSNASKGELFVDLFGIIAIAKIRTEVNLKPEGE